MKEDFKKAMARLKKGFDRKYEDSVESAKLARDESAKLEQQVNRFYQGALGGTLGLDVRGKTPRLKVAQRVKDIQAEPLVKDLTGGDTVVARGTLGLDRDFGGGYFYPVLLEQAALTVE